MLLPIPILVLILLAAFWAICLLFLPLDMWKQYWADWRLIAIKAALLFAVVCIAGGVFHHNVTAFAIGFICQDPFTYRFTIYKKPPTT